jgi:hypothetical protein
MADISRMVSVRTSAFQSSGKVSRVLFEGPGAAFDFVGQCFHGDRTFNAEIDRYTVHCASDLKFRGRGVHDVRRRGKQLTLSIRPASTRAAAGDEVISRA